MKTAYLGLGTNIGDREANLHKAVETLGSDRLRVIRQSSVFESAPRDVLDQPDFLNQVIEVETDLFPHQLFERAKHVERVMGRLVIREKGPRVIDIDVLLYGNVVVQREDLHIPHLRMAERRFVLEPLSELAPDLRHPVLRRTIRELLSRVRDQEVRRVS